MRVDADVVVLGGGAAGLAAARSLGARGCDVVVLEARGRPGGRIRTLRAADGAANELGAELVHGAAPRTLAALKRVGARVRKVSNRHHVETSNGPRRAEGMWDRLFGVMEQLAPEQGDASVEEMLARVDAPRGDEAFARNYVTGFHAADPDFASARDLAAEESGGGSGGAERMARVVGGQDAVVRGLLRGAHAAIRTRCVVEHVAHDARGVTVEGRGPLDAPFRVTAKHAVVALPLGVLHAGDVAFDPPLAWPLDTVAAGAAVRVVLELDAPFWEEHIDRLAMLFGKGAFTSFWPTGGREPRMVAWCGGRLAHELSKLTEAEDGVWNEVVGAAYPVTFAGVDATGCA